jgi:carboxymethylenebutenolidase
MASEMIDITAADGQRFRGFLSVPESGSGPGLVMLQEILGVNADMRTAADLFAEEGYVVLVPDLFWRIRPGVELGYDPHSYGEALSYLHEFDFNQAVADIGSAVSALRARPECSGKIGAIGYCLGGALTFLAAARLPVDAAVAYYGVGIEKYLSEAPNIRCPLLMHFGTRDAQVPAETVHRIKDVFSGRTEVSVSVFADAGHGFANAGRAEFHRPSAQLAHSQTLAVLRAAIGPQINLSALWDRHCECEFNERDVNATMATMVAEPYVNHVPTMTGGVGYAELYRFYKNHFLARLPQDTRIVPVSRTVGADRVVDELLFCFTHDIEIDFLLPNVPPTGKYVEAPTVAVVCFRGEKIYHEHIYWDQASVLVQIGLLDPKNLPVAGVETARKLVDESRPSNALMARWHESANQSVQRDQ